MIKKKLLQDMVAVIDEDIDVKSTDLIGFRINSDYSPGCNVGYTTVRALRRFTNSDKDYLRYDVGKLLE
jgi:hypothetical protein